MIKIKKILSICLVAALALSLTACSSSDEETATNQQEQETTTQEEVVAKEYNYLTGEDLQEGQTNVSRPVAVMINNAKQALPQKGLTSAQVIYETVTEGGITRLMALYPNVESVGTVGPVRSARDQFIEFVLPSNAIYVNIGGSASATEMLNMYNYQNVDGLYLGENAFFIDEEREKVLSPEHCWFTTSDLITQGINQNAIQLNGNGYPVFNFELEKDSAPLEGESAINISFSYSEYAPVTFTYDIDTNKYFKTAFGAPHIDAETNEQLSFDNVFVLYAYIGFKENLVVPDYYLENGEGYYFYGGEYKKITYTKAEPRAPLVIMDEDGEEIKVNVGESYVGIVDVLKMEEIVITGVETLEETVEE